MFGPYIALFSLYLFYISIVSGLWQDSTLFKGLMNYFAYPSLIVTISMILKIFSNVTNKPLLDKTGDWIFVFAVILSLLSILLSSKFLGDYEEATKKQCL
jgi:hypothetical protein